MAANLISVRYPYPSHLYVSESGAFLSEIRSAWMMTEVCLQREKVPEWVAQLPAALQDVGAKEILLVSEEGGRLAVLQSSSLCPQSLPSQDRRSRSALHHNISFGPSTGAVGMECLKAFKEMLFSGEVWG